MFSTADIQLKKKLRKCDQEKQDRGELHSEGPDQWVGLVS